ncbi:MAG TPA: chemotaxis protein CheW [Thermoanaerobaculia bacterium]
MTAEMLIVTIGGLRCAVPMERVLEVRVHQGSTRIPGSPDWVCGVIEREGVATQVVDAARRHGRQLTFDERNCLVFVEGRGAMLVDGVEGIAEVSDDSVVIDLDQMFGGAA